MTIVDYCVGICYFSVSVMLTVMLHVIKENSH